VGGRKTNGGKEKSNEAEGGPFQPHSGTAQDSSLEGGSCQHAIADRERMGRTSLQVVDFQSTNSERERKKERKIDFSVGGTMDLERLKWSHKSYSRSLQSGDAACENGKGPARLVKDTVTWEQRNNRST